ncbi:hypothetical protein GOODEAATRI_006874 [Goodea atripinnis]|uniref:Secreted protein n=1 Tax=Goodea atripinnis TaxID=208336 RepID=A0ABV0MZ99_9TELE
MIFILFAFDSIALEVACFACVIQTQKDFKCRGLPCKRARLCWLLLKSTYSKPGTSWHSTTAQRDFILIFIQLLAYDPVDQMFFIFILKRFDSEMKARRI